MPYTIPSIADFKGQFYRDFPFGIPLVSPPAGDSSDLSKVQDLDITNAINLANVNINQAFFISQQIFTTAFLYLAAHYLSTNLLNSSQGIAGAYDWLANAKNVGNVSAAFSIPQRILDSPYLSLLAKTTYGAQYLSIIAPLLIANVGVVRGMTLP